MVAVEKSLCIIVSVATLLVGFTIGILIGVYAVPRTSDGPNNEKDARDMNEVMEKLTSDAFVEKSDLTTTLIQAIDAKGIKEHLRHLGRNPHMAGTEGSKKVAEYIHKIWKEQGLHSVHMPSYDVLLSYPGEQPNEIEVIGSTGGVEFIINARELNKPFSDKDYPDAFHAYSPAKVVTGKLVYANYGTEDDFDQLESWNVSVKNKIVIARYGVIFRGNKVDNAAKRGAVGVILYTDPEEVAPFGTKPDDVYNKSKWLPGDGKQRGSVYEKIGDPLTPGLPALSDVARLDVDEADLPKIPSQPIGYAEAETLLSKMAGTEIKDDKWKGGLKIHYRLGPGFEGQWEHKTVRMNIHNVLKRSKIFNVIATIPGEIEPDRYVIVGNAHDAWGYGYVNPSSGTAQLLEISDAFSKLVKEGWHPRRTIIFCTWDASKYGQIGSTEWVEEHLAELSARTVAYINCESCIETEDIRVSASPILRQASIDVARMVHAPDDDDNKKDETIFDEWAEDHSSEEDADDQDMDGQKGDDDDDIVISPLGAESDHAAFAFYAGIPSIDVHADDEGTTNFFPAQNTPYDVADYLEKFVDPGNKRSVSCAQYIAVMVRYLADKTVLPYDVDQLGAILRFTVDKIDESEVPKMLTARNITLFDDLEEAVKDFEKSTQTFNSLLAELDTDDPIATRVVNDQMMLLERAFIKPSGQTDDWFHRHLLFGPSDLDKYSDSIFPDLMDLLKEIDEIMEEEEEERLNQDSDEGKHGDIDPEEHWEDIDRYLSDLLVAIKMAKNFLTPFPAAYQDNDIDGDDK